MTTTQPVSEKIDKTFTAILEKSPARGGWTYVVTDWTAEFFGHTEPGEGVRDRRRSPLPQLLHASR